MQISIATTDECLYQARQKPDTTFLFINLRNAITDHPDDGCLFNFRLWLIKVYTWIG